ncbi:flavin-dependent oxidoreductase [Dyadobacter jejuensis]|uniref:Flavin-dependent oxidoreductase n=1 Tax=Dyadobacter jejuensis TaxID=1082580 RepID=A0A316AC57_9BACT|nr:siderophore-interacting protein [Dyadobacter jejuensis]PWJ54464.1 flavin-dependent oxidoreductase [Dyadobacter jejuensis]
MGIVEALIKKVLEKGTVEQITKLSDSVFKIRIQSEQIKTAEFVPGYFIRLGVGIGKEDITLKDKVRSYSVWDMDVQNGTIDLAIATHSKGIGAQWVESCEVGTPVHFKWKKGNFLLDSNADSYLMIGDLSALSHLYVIARHLPADKQVEGLVYSQNSSDFFADVDDTKPFNFQVLERNPQEAIIDRLKQIIPKMQGKKMVYIAGDSRLCVSLNQYFKKELNWDSKQIKNKPFWNPDKKGLE